MAAAFVPSPYFSFLEPSSVGLYIRPFGFGDETDDGAVTLTSIEAQVVVAVAGGGELSRMHPNESGAQVVLDAAFYSSPLPGKRFRSGRYRREGRR